MLILTIFFTLPRMTSAENQQSTSSSKRFEKALPGYRFSFPRDHGSHPSYLIEWWYFTGNLQSEMGNAYGYELTFFRRGIENRFENKNPSRWTVRDIYLAHFAVTDIGGKNFYYDEKMSREAIGKAGAKEEKMDVWIDHWSLVQEGEAMLLRAGNDEFRIALALQPEKPLVIHGTEGISRKQAESDAATHYYSFTRLKTSGKLTTYGKEAAVSGLSWMDHEFGSSMLGEDQMGWDWFSIQLDDGSEYMFYQIRRRSGGKDEASSGTAVFPNGKTRHLSASDFSLTPLSHWKSQKSGGNYPIEWNISVPSEGLILTSEPVLAEQELITSKSTRVTYWEGASNFVGKKRGRPIAGKGYVELTGYAKDLKE